MSCVNCVLCVSSVLRPSLNHSEANVCARETVDMRSLTEHQRSVIIGLSMGGMAISVIAIQMNIHRNTVTNTLRKFRTTGSTSDLPRSGRPRCTTPAHDQYIRVQHLRDRFRTAVFTARSIPNLRRISASTVGRRLKSQGIKAHRPAVRCTLTENHKRARLNWCRQRQNWNHNQWRSVLFTDESRFCLQRTSGRAKVYRSAGERYTQGCILEKDSHRGGSVMVWGGITSRHKTGLVVVQGNLTAQRYIDQIITPEVIPFIRANDPMILQQDNARPHAANLTLQHLNTNQIALLPWPSKSPDLNPIEHLWDEIERRLKKRQHVLATVGRLSIETF